MAGTRHSPSRPIGRPQLRSAVDARELLLDAAVVLFSERGVAGTTVAEIATRAGVTPAMVHYYFTNRDRLLDAVAEERVLSTVHSVWAPVLEETTVTAMLRGLVRRIIRANEANPWLASLWLREIVSEGGQLRPRLLKNLPIEHVSHLVRAVARAQGRGELRAGLEPRLLVPSILGLTMLPLATMPLWKQIPLLNGVTREHVARHAETLLLSACLSPARKGSRAP
jgi:AcrR family transcriptional regulator